jgi:hypothetical protein
VPGIFDRLADREGLPAERVASNLFIVHFQMRITKSAEGTQFHLSLSALFSSSRSGFPNPQMCDLTVLWAMAVKERIVPMRSYEARGRFATSAFDLLKVPEVDLRLCGFLRAPALVCVNQE